MRRTRSSKALFIASTGQNVGKTTACLGLFSGFRKKFANVGYMKPIGQKQVETSEGLNVDKDVLLFKEHFAIKDASEHMSPLLVPPRFTRDFLDGKMSVDSLKEKIDQAFQTIQAKHDLVLVEGTGHCGVGSIINLNNAQVAALLKLPVVLIGSGGLGSAFDELTLNKILCDHYGVNIVGVILNRVRPEKKDMIAHYMHLALKNWNIPLLGCIPFDPLLSHPSMKDLETLFHTTLLSGEAHRLTHFKHTRLIATSVETYREWLPVHQLLITPANREDIILATVTKYWEHVTAQPLQSFDVGMILTGNSPPRHYILDALKKADIPMLYVPLHSDTAMQMITSFTAKIANEDLEKVQEAIDIMEQHIDFEKLFSLL
jgi:phosphate acetyltransferase